MSLIDLVSGVVDLRLLYAALIVLAAGLMRGFAGFGSAMAMSPIFAILFGPAEMVIQVTMLELLVSAYLAPGALRDVDWRFVGPMSCAAILAMPLGAGILFWADPDVLTRAVSAIVLLFVVVLLAGWRYSGPKRLPITLGLGAVSGSMMATTAIGGPPVLIYMLSGPDKAVTNRANIIIYFGVTGIFLLAVMIWNGLAEPAGIVRVALLTPLFWAASYAGQRMFRQSSEKLYRRIAFLFLAAIGLYGLLHG